MSPRCVRGSIPAYEGWGCFLTTVFIGLLAILLIIGIGGPWYHDCEKNDCSAQVNYGLYCEDYCWSGQTGPGSGLVLIIAFCVFFALLLPICWQNYRRGRTPRRLFGDDYSYQVINVN